MGTSGFLPVPFPFCHDVHILFFLAVVVVPSAADGGGGGGGGGGGRGEVVSHRARPLQPSQAQGVVTGHTGLLALFALHFADVLNAEESVCFSSLFLSSRFKGMRLFRRFWSISSSSPPLSRICNYAHKKCCCCEDVRGPVCVCCRMST